MQHLLDALPEIAKNSTYLPNLPRDIELIERYLRTGDEKLFPSLQAISDDHLYPLSKLASALPSPSQWSEEDKRVVRFGTLRCATLFPHLRKNNQPWDSSDCVIREAVDRALQQESAEEDLFSPFVREFTSLGIPLVNVATLAVDRFDSLPHERTLNSVGRFLFSSPPETLASAFVAKTEGHCFYRRTVEYWIKHHEDHALAVAKALLEKGEPDAMPYHGWRQLLIRNPEKHESVAAAALARLKHPGKKFDLGCQLVECFPGKYDNAVWALSSDALNADFRVYPETPVVPWMTRQRGTDAVPLILQYMDSWESNNVSLQHWKVNVLEQTVSALGVAARPVILAAFQPGMPLLRRAAFTALIGLSESSNDEKIASLLQSEFTEKDTSDVIAAIPIATSWNFARMAPHVWKLLAHKSKPVREAAIAALATLGESAAAEAVALLGAKKADTRAAAATLLGKLKTPAAIEALRSALDREESDAVGDAIRSALAGIDQNPAGGVSSATPSRAAVEATIRKFAPKAKIPADWIKLESLPTVSFNDGIPLGADATKYLLARQSRCKSIEADDEARPLYALIDRASCGDFALTVLAGFIGSGADAKDRWALAIAGLLGDERVVPVLSRQIQEWADSARGKLAEYAVQALALQASDPALLAVDGLAIRYRTKYKNIGKAASEAFNRAAEARGLSPAELGDRVIPWLGFTPDQPRHLSWGDTKLEVTIGLDFKPAYRDLVKNKRVSSLLSSAPAEIKAEMKELSAALKEAVKAQLLRLENLMVQQHRWPSARWTELFLKHPLLLPFAIRLVWGEYDEAGRLMRTFRALEDCTLTTAADEPAPAPTAGSVGMVHPLELEASARAEWLTHLADYEIAPPFPQMERAVMTPPADQLARKMFDTFNKTELNAMTFRGRAEKRGWVRGSVVDAGGVPYYYKPFPAAGVDVFLYLDGMYVGIDMYSSITLGSFYFVRHGSVEIGSYTYDEPSKENDARLVPAGEVPPIAYSEALGDLRHIAGKAGATEA